MRRSGRRESYRADNLARLEPGVPSSLGPTCLIVCPASVIYNWQREFQLWTYMAVGVYGGSAEERRSTVSMFRQGLLDVVIAGIEATRDNIGTFQHLDFTCVVVDEAHRLKDPKSLTSRALRKLPTLHRYALTGTAIQNKTEELWAVLDWVVPGKVGDLRQWQVSSLAVRCTI